MKTSSEPTTSISLLDLLERWVERPGLAEETRRRDRWALRLTLDQFDGARSAGSISKAEILEWRDLLAEAFPGGGTPRIVMAVLVRGLEHGYAEGLVNRLVTVGIPLMKSARELRAQQNGGRGMRGGSR